LNNVTLYPFTIIESNQGWTRQSYTLESMELAPSERVVIFVDFSGLPGGDELRVVHAMPCAGTLANTAKGTIPLSKMFYQMQFTVNSSIPATSGRCPSSEQLDPLLAERVPKRFQDLEQADPIRTREVSFHIFNSASVIMKRSSGTTSGGNTVTIEEACGVDISEYASSQVVSQKPNSITASFATNYRLGELGVPYGYNDPMTIYPQVGVPEWWMYTNLSGCHPMPTRCMSMRVPFS
jgi:FtsP/CotA-like multicopper oxidase with cupredoxin domain